MSGLLRRLWKFLIPGELSDTFRAELEAEGLLFLAENIGVRIHYRNFKAPGKRFWRRAEVTLALTTQRIVGYAFRRTVLELPYSGPAFEAVRFSIASSRTSRPASIRRSSTLGSPARWSSASCYRTRTCCGWTASSVTVRPGAREPAYAGAEGGAARRAGSTGLISPTAFPLGSSTIA